MKNFQYNPPYCNYLLLSLTYNYLPVKACQSCLCLIGFKGYNLKNLKRVYMIFQFLSLLSFWILLFLDLTDYGRLVFLLVNVSNQSFDYRIIVFLTSFLFHDSRLYLFIMMKYPMLRMKGSELSLVFVVMIITLDSIYGWGLSDSNLSQSDIVYTNFYFWFLILVTLSRNKQLAWSLDIKSSIQNISSICLVFSVLLVDDAKNIRNNLLALIPCTISLLDCSKRCLISFSNFFRLTSFYGPDLTCLIWTVLSVIEDFKVFIVEIRDLRKRMKILFLNLLLTIPGIFFNYAYNDYLISPFLFQLSYCWCYTSISNIFIQGRVFLLATHCLMIIFSIKDCFISPLESNFCWMILDRMLIYSTVNYKLLLITLLDNFAKHKLTIFLLLFRIMFNSSFYLSTVSQHYWHGSNVYQLFTNIILFGIEIYLFLDSTVDFKLNNGLYGLPDSKKKGLIFTFPSFFICNPTMSKLDMLQYVASCKPWDLGKGLAIEGHYYYSEDLPCGLMFYEPTGIYMETLGYHQ